MVDRCRACGKNSGPPNQTAECLPCLRGHGEEADGEAFDLPVDAGRRSYSVCLSGGGGAYAWVVWPELETWEPPLAEGFEPTRKAAEKAARDFAGPLAMPIKSTFAREHLARKRTVAREKARAEAVEAKRQEVERRRLEEAGRKSKKDEALALFKAQHLEEIRLAIEEEARDRKEARAKSRREQQRERDQQRELMKSLCSSCLGKSPLMISRKGVSLCPRCYEEGNAIITDLSRMSQSDRERSAPAGPKSGTLVVHTNREDSDNPWLLESEEAC